MKMRIVPVVLLTITLLQSAGAAVIPVFSDNFESGTMANWTATAATPSPLDPSTVQNIVPPSPGGRFSAFMNVSTDRMHRNVIADNGGAEVGGHFMFSAWIYDEGVNGGTVGATRIFNEVRGYSGGTGLPNGGTAASGALAQLLAAGKFNATTLPGDVFTATKYQGRVAFHSPQPVGDTGWFNLNDPVSPNRSIGWHRFDIEAMPDGTTFKFYVDGILSRTFTGGTASTYDSLILGPGLGTQQGNAWIDGIALTIIDDRPDAPERFFPSNTLPPPEGMYVTPQQFHAAYAQGIIISNISHRRFTEHLPPPPPGGQQTHSFGSEVRMDVSTDGGQTFAPMAAPAQVTVNLRSSTGNTFDTEMLQLNIAGGTLPPGVMIRESPSKASTGRTTVRQVTGGYMIGSFFDVFTELSLDGGQNWSPAQQAAHVELRGDPTQAPVVPAPDRVLPPRNAFYVTPAQFHAAYAQGIIIRDIRHKYFTQSLPPPPPGAPPQPHHFDSQVDMQVSMDGGQTFRHMRAPAAVDVLVASRSNWDGTDVFDTEMLSLHLQGGDLPPGVMIRESPTRRSEGGTAITGSSDGTHRIQSFFDVFTELSVDGGQNWSPADSAARVGLTYNAPETPEPSPNLPPPDGNYVSPADFHAAYAAGIIIKDIKHNRFTQSQPPPPPGGTQVHSFGSQVQFQVSTDGGATFSPASAPAQAVVRVDSSDTTETVRSFDTEMLQLNIAGGSLPAGVMIRESPSRASLGRTSIRQTPDAYQISSFFDVFTELSVDGGQTWEPSLTGPVGVILAPGPCYHLTCPPDMSVTATSAAGAVVTYPPPQFTFDPPCTLPVTPVIFCTPPSGSTFPIGTTTVRCRAEVGAGAALAACSFEVTVRRPIEIDFFDYSLAHLTLSMPDGSTETVVLAGPTEVEVDIFPDGSTGDSDGDGLDDSATRMTKMQLNGIGRTGTMSVRLAAGSPTTGMIEEMENKVQGKLDIPPFGQGTARSFFDVFVEIEIQTPNGPVVLHNQVAVHMEAIIRHKPPAPGDTYVNPFTQPVELYDANNNPTGIRILREVHTPNIEKEIDRFTYSLAQIGLRYPNGQTEQIVLAGPAEATVCIPPDGSAADTDGDGRDQVPTQLTGLNLVGNSSQGPVVVTLDPSQPSLGEIEERANNTAGKLDIPPFTPTGSADSYFNVRARIQVGANVFYPNVALHIATVITHKPPRPGETYISAIIGQPAPAATPCIVPDNGSGTVDLPPAGCDYLSPNDVHMIIDGLPPGTTIQLGATHNRFFCPTGGVNTCSFSPPPGSIDCDRPGGNLGGEQECAQSTLQLNLTGTGMLAGWNRQIQLPAGFETHIGPRTPGNPVQSFDTDMFRLFGQITGDPDFDLLRIVAGTDFGLPSPGHTTLTRQPSGSWNVDSFFDITYRIDFVGRQGGTLSGRSGSTTGTIRMQTGEPAPTCPVQLLTATGQPTGICLINESHTPNIEKEIDHFPNSVAQLTLQLPGGGTETINLSGPSTVEVCIPPTGAAADTDSDGLDQTPTRMTLLNLTGTSSMGPVQVSLDPAHETLGEIEEDGNATPGTLDIRPFRPAGTAHSFFDVFPLIRVGPRVFRPAAPLHLAAIIHHKPPAPGDTYVNPFTQPVELLDENGQPTGIFVIREVHTPNPAVEIDRFDNTSALVGLRMPDGSLVNVILNGPATVEVDLTSLGDRQPNGREEVTTELVTMNLTGSGVTLVAGSAHGLPPSVGAIEENVNVQPGRLDLPGPDAPFCTPPTAANCVGTSADSFFDVFFEVTLPDGQRLHNRTPLRVEAIITEKPPRANYRHVITQPIELFDDNEQPTGVFLVTANHDTRPKEIDRFENTSALVGLRMPDGSMVNVILNGPATVAVALDSLADGQPNGREEVTTELLTMNLTGSGVTLVAGSVNGLPPSVGAIEENVNVQPGRLDLPGPDAPFCTPPTAANCVGATADSFFDVFFEVTLPDGQRLHNQTPLRIQATITEKPPRSNYRHVITQPIELYDANNNPTGVFLVTANHDTRPKEIDRFSNTSALVGLRMPDGSLVNVILNGPATVAVALDSLHDAPANGLEEVTTELVAMNLAGSGFQLVAGSANGLPASMGEIEETQNRQASRLDLPGPDAPFCTPPVPANCTGTSATSFFDVFFVVTTPGGQQLHNRTPLRVEAIITEKPPRANYRHVITQPIELYDDNNNPTGVFLVTANHDTRPKEIDRFERTSALVGLRMPDGSLVNVILNGPATVAVALDSLDDRQPNGLEEVTTELVAMNLAGSGYQLIAGSANGLPASSGEIEENVNVQPGRLDLPGPDAPFCTPPTAANCVGATADSFFDVFFEVIAPDGQRLHNRVPLRIEATITEKPPRAIYRHVITEPIELYDANNNPTGVFLVTANHSTGPCLIAITCPNDITANNDPGECGAKVHYPIPAFSASCPPAGVACDPPSGSFFPVGTSVVTCTARDQLGNEARCTFRITVRDTEPPRIVCPNDITASNDPNACSAKLDYPPATATDNCPGVSAATCSPAPGSSFPVGTTPVTCTAVDAAGNSSTCTFTVTVRDTEPPRIVCPDDIRVWACSPNGMKVDYPTPTASDNCPNVAVSCVPPSGSNFTPGTTPVVCTATDSAGNSNRCTFRVTVILDSGPPTINCPSNQVVRTCASSAVIRYHATATDDCDPTPTIVCNPPSGTALPAGTHTVTCRATDDCGKTSECKFDVRVVQIPPPKLTIRPIGNGQVAICWPLDATGFRLQCTDTLNPPGPPFAWKDITNAVVQMDDQNCVIFDARGPHRFYRLYCDDRPWIGHVTPTTGVKEGDVITIHGAGFGNNPNNICAVVVEPSSGQPGGRPVQRWLPLRALFAGDTFMTARMGPVPPDAQPGPIMVGLGTGSVGRPHFVFPDIEAVDPIWVWQKDGPAAIGEQPVQPQPGPPGPVPPEELCFQSGPPTNGALCVFIRGNWPSNATICVVARAHDSENNTGGYDLDGPTIRFLGGGTTADCAERLADVLRCAFLSQAGVVIDVQVDEVPPGSGVFKLTIRIPNGYIDRGFVSICVKALNEPVIDEVIPTAATTGEIIRIVGRNFGNNPNNICAVVMDGSRMIPFRVLDVDADGKTMRARLGVVPPDVNIPGPAAPMPIMVGRGQGQAGKFRPAFFDVFVADDVWTWNKHHGPAGLSQPIFVPRPTQPPPQTVWFHNQPITDGRICTVIRGNWPSNACVSITARAHDSVTGAGGYDLDGPRVIFTGGGKLEDCAKRIADVLRCAFLQQAGVDVTVDIIVMPDGSIMICVRIPGGYIDRGILTICVSQWQPGTGG